MQLSSMRAGQVRLQGQFEPAGHLPAAGAGGPR
jgi:hypothetical protein